MTIKDNIGEVAQKLKHGLPEERRAAASKLGRIRDIDTIPHLVDAALKDGYKMTRIAAIQSLAWIQDKQALEPLMKIAILDEDELVRKFAIEAIGSIKDEASLEGLNHIVDNELNTELKTAASIAIQIIQGITPDWSQDRDV